MLMVNAKDVILFSNVYHIIKTIKGMSGVIMIPGTHTSFTAEEAASRGNTKRKSPLPIAP